MIAIIFIFITTFLAVWAAWYIGWKLLVLFAWLLTLLWSLTLLTLEWIGRVILWDFKR